MLIPNAQAEERRPGDLTADSQLGPIKECLVGPQVDLICERLCLVFCSKVCSRNHDSLGIEIGDACVGTYAGRPVFELVLAIESTPVLASLEGQSTRHLDHTNGPEMGPAILGERGESGTSKRGLARAAIRRCQRTSLRRSPLAISCLRLSRSEGFSRNLVPQIVRSLRTPKISQPQGWFFKFASFESAEKYFPSFLKS